MLKKTHIRLLDAIRSGNVPALQHLILTMKHKELGDLKYKYSSLGWTYLHHAADSGNPQIIEIFCKLGLDVNANSTKLNPGHLTIVPIELAVKKRHLDAVKQLIFFGANFNFITHSGKSLIELAIRNNDIKMTTVLWSFGAELLLTPNCRADLYNEGYQEILTFIANPPSRTINLTTPVTAYSQQQINGNIQAVVQPQVPASPPSYQEAISQNITMNPQSARSKRFDKASVPLTQRSDSFKALVGKIDKQRQDLFKPSDLSLLRGDLINVICNEDTVRVQEMLNRCSNFDGFNITFRDDKGYNFIHYAIIRGDPTILNLLFNALMVADVDIDNLRTSLGFLPIHLAIVEGNASIVKHLLDMGVDVNARTSDVKKLTALCLAVTQQDLAIIKILLQGSADINFASVGSFRPLDMAVQQDSFDIVNCLLQNKAEVNYFTGDMQSPLAIAVEKHNLQMIKLLTEHGANFLLVRGATRMRLEASMEQEYQEIRAFYSRVNIPSQTISNELLKMFDFLKTFCLHDYNNTTPEMILIDAVKTGDKICLKFILDFYLRARRVNFSYQDKYGWSVLHYAVLARNIKNIKMLIDAGFQLTLPIKAIGFYPIHLATIIGAIEIIKLLVEHKAPLIQVVDDGSGRQPIHLAAEKGDDAVLSYLQEQGIDVNAKAVDLFSLHFATLNHQIETVKYLLENKADINVADSKLSRPLDIAVMNSDSKILQYLLQNRAEINYYLYNNYSPLHLAIQQGNMAIAKLLLTFGANVNISNQSGLRPLDLAVKNNNLTMIELLLQNQAIVNYLTNDGHSPLALAIKNNNLDMVKLLHQYGASFILVRGKAKAILEKASSSQLDAIKDYYVEVAHAAVDIPNDVCKKFSFLGVFLAIRKPVKSLAEILVDAIKSGSESSVKIVLDLCLQEDNFNFEYQDKYGWKFIHYAVVVGNVTNIKSLAQAGVNINSNIVSFVYLSHAVYPIHLAAALGNLSVLDYLLGSGVDINQTGLNNAHRALGFAILGGHEKAVAFLLKQGAVVNYRDQNAYFPVHIAVNDRNFAMVKLLVEYGADVNCVVNDQHPLDLAINDPVDLSIVEFLLKNGAKINYFIRGNNSPLSMAIINNNLDLVKLLWNYGASKIILKGKAKKIIDGKKDKKYLDIALFFANNTGQSRTDNPLYERKDSLQDIEIDSCDTLDSELTASQGSVTSPAAATIDDFGGISISIAIPYHQLTFNQKIGEGGFGAVYKGVWKHEVVALKLLYMKTLAVKALEEFKNEITVMAALRHPRIVQLFGACFEEGKYSMVMEYMPNGSLYQILHNDQPLSWNLRYQIAMDITSGLSLLHSKDILHRDIKSLNVLLDDNMRAKLTDFGLSKIKTETASSSAGGNNQSVGTLAWMAPELFKRKAKYTKESDIYSYGMVLWELATRETPFADAANPALISQWVTQGEQEEIPDEVENKYPSYAKLIRRCWELRQEQRPTIEQAAKELEENSIIVDDVDRLLTQQKMLNSGPNYVDNLQSNNL